MDKEQLEYVVRKVMNAAKYSNLDMAITYNKCSGFANLMELSSEAIEDLSYEDSKGTLMKLGSYEKSILYAFHRYCGKCFSEGNQQNDARRQKIELQRFL